LTKLKGVRHHPWPRTWKMRWLLGRATLVLLMKLESRGKRAK
jgi:hypothetical protein